MDIKEQVKAQFGANASNYVVSTRHSSGQDLNTLIEWAQSENAVQALDIATGGGHCALALASHVSEVTTLDIATEMLQQAETFLAGKGCTNMKYVVGDAENLPFVQEQFDIVACRIAAHHFPNPNRFVEEAWRVLKHGGSFILMDNVAPESDRIDTLYNHIEQRRDPSHFRAWKKTEWIRRIELNGFQVEQLLQTGKPFEFTDWCARMNVSDQIQQELENDILNWPEADRQQLKVHSENGKLLNFEGSYMMMKARKF
ncbi:class I SAM-dependent methyltransferase [Paenibacillus qinlingensis]|uniref:Ubiquinone/menaquinone biosynthesis C-methylase UbiE n=1 Tax=Paenibacillus qinlingensis TaxID=1837343 RepID=A0ABU1P685_9BACL|nr:class I SAM-dependent methyltransferase [Paenibacillus qinlingensis]MDR6555064.1 ubiquinone/menaquinone biosynthesis C-methylase UbiE [Paenibacillus qinlingensis]